MHTAFRIAFLVAFLANTPACARGKDQVVWLDTLDLGSIVQSWGAPQANCSVLGNPIRIGGRIFHRGIGTHAASSFPILLAGTSARFSAWVGVDDEMKGHPASVEFVVRADGRELWRSGVMHVGDPARRVDLKLAKVHRLDLEVTDAGDGIDSDHADWADASLILSAPMRPGTLYGIPELEAPRGRCAVTLRSGRMRALFSRNGVLVGLGGTAGEKAWPVVAATVLENTRILGSCRCSTDGRTWVRFTKRVASVSSGAQCTVIDTFRAAPMGLRWEVDIRGIGRPWSTPIHTVLRWPNVRGAQFWTAWADPRRASATGWSDPLEPQPWAGRSLWYGALPFRPANPMYGYCPWPRNTFCLPMATVIYPRRRSAFSVVLSPRDLILEMRLATDPGGTMTFARYHHRIRPGRSVHFALDVVEHQADWRPGLGWMVQRYPESFRPVVPSADAMAGCGAYSSYQGPLDVQKLKAMAFRTNWQASFEFPYMGMFLPPVADGEEWRNFRGVLTSFDRLNRYYTSMRSLGFFVLSYFNVTEVGARIAYPPPPLTLPESDRWRDANQFLYGTLNQAWIRDPEGKPIYSWEGAVAMDPGDPAYRQFLLEQARRHLAKTPATSGICIDRTDWLRLYNTRADDGVSWFEGGPARSLMVSWRSIMGRLGPLMHRAGKTIFCNMHVKRLEILRYADGIFDEFTYHPASINQDGLLGICKPVIGWTADESNLKPRPDEFFQRLLYMGIFPMCPYPGNDHSILPNPWAEDWYRRYGPLLDAMRGKKWVLTPHPVAVVQGRALVNAFHTPQGLVLPVVFGGSAQRVRVRLRCVPAASARYLETDAVLPGRSAPARVRVSRCGRWLDLDVPLEKGCAMVRVRWKSGKAQELPSTGTRCMSPRRGGV
ncbi:MAG: NPCBM/NEW2 domain-containing protein [Chthonomonadales bacterium]